MSRAPRRGMDRRGFIRVALTGAGALWVGVELAGCTSPEVRRMQTAAERDGVFRPSAHLAITPQDRVEVWASKIEMGQGTYTTYALLVAEELRVDPSRIDVSTGSGADFETFNMQVTGGSSSTREAWGPLREAGATARVMLVGAAADQWKVPAAECVAADGKVTHAASGRSARYGELVTAAARRPIPEKVELTPAKGFRLIGKPQPRIDLIDKVTGAPIFGVDVEVEGLLHAVVIHPPVLGARPSSFKPEAALGMPGVVRVLPIASGVAVVARKHWQAQRAAAKVEVVWDEGDNARLDTTALYAAAVEATKGSGASHRSEGDAADAIEGAAKVIEAVYSGPFAAHAPLEPQNATAHVVPGERARVWAPTQFQSGVRDLAARVAGIDRADVELVTTYLGGGFGRRGVTDAVEEALHISAALRQPVQVLWSREDDTRGGYYRPMMLGRIKAGLDAEGMPTGLYVHALSKSVFALGSFAPSLLPEGLPADVMVARAVGQLTDSGTVADPIATEGLTSMAYAIPAVRVEYTPMRVDVPVTFWRSVGHSVNAFIAEGFVDELAEAAGVDPVEYRRKLLPADSRARKVLDAAVELGRWGSPVEPGYGRGVAVHESFGSWCAQVVEAGVIDGEIKVRRVACALDCGVQINPDQIEAQMHSCVVYGLSAAIWQRIDLEGGRVAQGNFDDYRLMRMNETPEIAVTLIDSDEDPSGVGEPGVPPIAPALAGALFAATGKRLRAMPFADAIAEVG